MIIQKLELVKAFLKRTQYLWILLIFVAYTAISFGFYLARTLNGDINAHMLPAAMFGTPEALKAKGIKSFYYDPTQAGWDGQFYYYISNDIFARKDTPFHIDAPSYRYQRVGLSLYAKLIAKLTGQSWVSPKTFIASYFALILIATIFGAKLFERVNLPPILILIWSLGVGTQITLFNALPDAAADAFLILALYAFSSRKYGLSAIPFIFSALSREVYVLFPSIAFLVLALQSSTGNGSFIDKSRNALHFLFRPSKAHWLLLPGVISVAWLAFIIHRFGIKPSDQAHGILGLPMAAWYEYFRSGITGHHKLLGADDWSYIEALCLFLFALILASAALLSLRVIALGNRASALGMMIGAVSLIFSVLYACFGPTVIMHYTGYFKAVGVFFLSIPLLLNFGHCPAVVRKSVMGLLFASLAASSYYNFSIRILPFAAADDKYTKMSSVTGSDRTECFGEYSYAVKVNEVSVLNQSLINQIFGKGDKIIVVDLTLKNTGEIPYISTRGFGSVFMSYHWIDSNGNVIIDGVRSALPGTLMPGTEARVQVFSPIPVSSQQLRMILSPVQEGCAWFYMATGESSSAIKITVGH